MIKYFIKCMFNLAIWCRNNNCPRLFVFIYKHFLMSKHTVDDLKWAVEEVKKMSEEPK